MSQPLLNGSSAAFTASTYTGTDGNVVFGNPAAPVYRACGSILAANGNGANKDIISIIGPTTGFVMRITSIKMKAVGLTTAQASSQITLNRVAVSPGGTGTLTSVTTTQHDTAAAAPTATFKYSAAANSSQTAGTSPTVLAETNLGYDAGTADTSPIVCDLYTGNENGGQPIILRAGELATIRNSVALATASILSFDIAWTESVA